MSNILPILYLLAGGLGLFGAGLLLVILSICIAGSVGIPLATGLWCFLGIFGNWAEDPEELKKQNAELCDQHKPPSTPPILIHVLIFLHNIVNFFQLPSSNSDIENNQNPAARSGEYRDRSEEFDMSSPHSRGFTPAKDAARAKAEAVLSATGSSQKQNRLRA